MKQQLKFIRYAFFLNYDCGNDVQAFLPSGRYATESRISSKCLKNGVLYILNKGEHMVWVQEKSYRHKLAPLRSRDIGEGGG